MAYLFRISKPGYNALTETNPKNLVLDSSVNHLKTVLNGSKIMTISAYSGRVEVVYHGLGYYPLALGYYKLSSDPNKWYICMTVPIEDPYTYRALTDVSIGIGVDQNYLYFSGYNGGGTDETVEVRYEVFFEGV